MSPAPEAPVVPLSQKEAPAVPLSQKEAPVVPLSQWLQLMLAEIARKRAEQERGHAEEAQRAGERAAETQRAPTAPSGPPR